MCCFFLEQADFVCIKVKQPVRLTKNLFLQQENFRGLTCLALSTRAKNTIDARSISDLDRLKRHKKKTQQTFGNFRKKIILFHTNLCIQISF